MQKAKQMADQIREPADVWKLERYRTERRKKIDGMEANVEAESVKWVFGSETIWMRQVMTL